MRDISVKKYKIKRLWTLCDQGVFAVPEIQREFLWDSKRASNLLDSVQSPLVWETGPHHRHPLRQAQEILPPHDDANPKTWFLIDGQQMLAVLYRAKEGHTVKNDRGRELDFSKLCFSFDKRYESRFLFIPSSPAQSPHTSEKHPRTQLACKAPLAAARKVCRYREVSNSGLAIRSSRHVRGYQ